MVTHFYQTLALPSLILPKPSASLEGPAQPPLLHGEEHEETPEGNSFLPLAVRVPPMAQEPSNLPPSQLLGRQMEPTPLPFPLPWILST